MLLRKSSFISIMVILSLNSVAQPLKKVLFLGNSYTYFNNMPKLLEDLAGSKGDSVFTDRNTPGGYTLQGHSTNSTSINKINSQKWDYVVLQEQSQRPSFPPSQVASDVYPYARTLNNLIKSNDTCTKTMFYMTWGRKNGDASNCASYPPLCTYLGMQQRLRDSYVYMANDNDAIVAPVGKAWKNSITADSNLNLYSPDESHPSIYGSYLTACVFYASIFHKTSTGGYHPSSISPLQALFLQGIADQTVFDSLSVWRIDTSELKASLSVFLMNNTQYSFVANTNEASANFSWSVEGVQYSTDSISHTFSGPGNYWVSLIVSEGCDSIYFEENIVISTNEIDDLKNLENIEVFPVPVESQLFIKGLDPKSESQISIFNNQGEKMFVGIWHDKGVAEISTKKPDIRTVPIAS